MFISFSLFGYYLVMVKMDLSKNKAEHTIKLLIQCAIIICNNGY